MAPQQSLRSPEGLAKAVVVLLIAVAVADLLAVAAGQNMRSLVGHWLDDGFDTGDEAAADRADLLYGAAGFLQALTMLAAAVLFIIWFRRTRMNAEVFAPGTHPMSPGWSIGAWFVPVANLVLPRRIAGGIWAASTPVGPDGSRRPAPTTVMNVWWALWAGSLLLSRFTSKKYWDAEEPQEIMDAAGLVMITDALDIVAAVFAILFVRKLTRMQGERAALGVQPFPTHF
ncbi:DUF4328 domain-containing protein [Streptomyces sp. NPDC014734]|uniref:DUF4328 domain-containing protein n=1 Tax=Streptomyces sp. NPDC014734 TaxID=3364886 RepID=UPI0036FA60FC